LLKFGTLICYGSAKVAEWLNLNSTSGEIKEGRRRKIANKDIIVLSWAFRQKITKLQPSSIWVDRSNYVADVTRWLQCELKYYSTTIGLEASVAGRRCTVYKMVKSRQTQLRIGWFCWNLVQRCLMGFL